MKVIRKSIAVIENKERKEIDKFIKDNCGLVFHEIEFNRIVSDVFKTEFSYLIAINNKKKIIGICPLHTIKKGLLKLTYSNPAIFEVPFGGWVFDDTQITIKELMAHTRMSYNESLTYRSNIQIKEDIYKNNISNISPHQTAIIDLSLEKNGIWKNIIHSKRRNMIRKAEKLGIKIKIFGSECFELYYPLMKETHEKTGQKTNPAKFYKSILETYFEKRQATILLAESDGKFISGIILIGNQYVMHYWQGASKRELPNSGQGELLQWEAIKWSKQNGCHYYDLCVVEKERLPHIAKFKLGFSKSLVSFYHISRKPVTFKILNRIQR